MQDSILPPWKPLPPFLVHVEVGVWSQALVEEQAEPQALEGVGPAAGSGAISTCSLTRRLDLRRCHSSIWDSRTYEHKLFIINVVHHAFTVKYFFVVMIVN